MHRYNQVRVHLQPDIAADLVPKLQDTDLDLSDRSKIWRAFHCCWGVKSQCYVVISKLNLPASRLYDILYEDLLMLIE